MNTGLQDAHNLAIKIAEVIRGTAPDEYLDRYEAERRPVAVRLIATTDRVFGLATSSTRRARLVRRRLAPLLAPPADLSRASRRRCLAQRTGGSRRESLSGVDVLGTGAARATATRCRAPQCAFA